MTRVLVALSPRMYRDAITLSVHRRRPGLDVRAAPPEAAEGEISGFRPHLIVYNDTAPISEGALEKVPWRVEIVYSDAMHSRVVADGRDEDLGDAGLDGLIGAVDGASALAGQEHAPGRA